MAPIDTRECYHCHKALTVKDRSAWFHMERDDIKEAPIMTFTSICSPKGNAGINLTTVTIPPLGTPGLLHQNVCPAPGLLHNRKCPGAGPIKDDVPGAGHLHQLAFKDENC